MVVRKIIERILEVGQTSITITDTDIPGSLVRTYSNDPDLMPVQLVLTGSTLRIDYETQTSDKYVAVELVKQGLDIIDNLTSNDTDAALSAKQGKVLKDLVDGIIPITELTELDDVLVTNLTDGDILKYDADNEVFKNYLLPDVPVYLGDLGDVVLDTVTAGQVLTYNGAYWTNATPTGGGNNYSTSETVIGTWIDGKNLYQRTIVTSFSGKTKGSRSWTTILAGNQGLSIKNVFGTITFSDDNTYSMNCMGHDFVDSDVNHYAYSSYRYNATGELLAIIRQYFYDGSASGYFTTTVQYTKDSDTAES